MPLNYQYVNKKTKQGEPLNIIDDQIAEFHKEKAESIGGTAKWLDSVTSFGLAIIAKIGVDKIDRAVFDAWLSHQNEKWAKEMQANNWLPCLRKFLYEDYTFSTWIDRKKK